MLPPSRLLASAMALKSKAWMKAGKGMNHFNTILRRAMDFNSFYGPLQRLLRGEPLKHHAGVPALKYQDNGWELPQATHFSRAEERAIARCVRAVCDDVDDVHVP
jgi:hypothetical protein